MTFLVLIRYKTGYNFTFSMINDEKVGRVEYRLTIEFVKMKNVILRIQNDFSVTL